MNRYFFFPVVVLCVFVISSGLALAQTTTATSTTKVTSEPAAPPTKRSFTTEPTLQKIAQTRLTNLAANMSNRMDSAVSRLQNVTDRLTSRLNKMEVEGKNVSAARIELALAQSKLDEAKSNLKNIDLEVNAFVGSATPRENWENLKNTYLGTRTVIIAAHQSILATINLAQTTTTAVPDVSSSTVASSTNN